MPRTPVLTAAAIAAALIGYAAAPASAATASLGGAPPALEKQTASNIELVQSRNYKKRRWYYNRGRHGPRYRYRHGHYNHHHDGWWYSRPWWGYGSGIALGLTVPLGGYYGGGYGYGGDGHVQWCLNRYRSYDPRSDTFMGYDGYRHRCNSPYGY
jgi:hypothetical protein